MQTLCHDIVNRTCNLIPNIHSTLITCLHENVPTQQTTTPDPGPLVEIGNLPVKPY